MESLNDNGLSNINPLIPPNFIAPISGGNYSAYTPKDSVSSGSGAKNSSGGVLADSPELQQAMYIFWFSNNQIIVQPYTHKTEETTVQSINALNFEINSKIDEITINVLTEWSKSIKEQVDADRREEKSEHHKRDLEERLKAGYEAYLSTLSFLQRLNSIETNTLTGVALPQGGFVAGLDDIINKSREGLNDITPFVTGAVLSVVPGSVAVNAMQVDPLSQGVASIMGQITPAYSVDLSSLATLFINGAVNLAAVQTFPVAPGSTNAKIDYEFANKYSQEILKIVSGSDFNNWAMAIITHQIGAGEQMDDKYVADLTGKLKLSMLSTALSFQYYMESSFKGKGGGITGVEFQDMINGKILLAQDDPKKELVDQIRSLLSSQSDPQSILAKIGDWIDSSAKGLNLTKVSPLFNLLKLDAGGVELLS